MVASDLMKYRKGKGAGRCSSFATLPPNLSYYPDQYIEGWQDGRDEKHWIRTSKKERREEISQSRKMFQSFLTIKEELHQRGSSFKEIGRDLGFSPGIVRDTAMGLRMNASVAEAISQRLGEPKSEIWPYYYRDNEQKLKRKPIKQ